MQVMLLPGAIQSDFSKPLKSLKTLLDMCPPQSEKISTFSPDSDLPGTSVTDKMPTP